jgi:hypothetical protein
LRRTLEVISLAMVLLGLELATGTPSLTIARLQETIAYPLGSDGAESVEWRVLGGLVVIVVALMLAVLTGPRSSPHEGSSESCRMPQVWRRDQAGPTQRLATNARWSGGKAPWSQALWGLRLAGRQLQALTQALIKALATHVGRVEIIQMKVN